VAQMKDMHTACLRQEGAPLQDGVQGAQAAVRRQRALPVAVIIVFARAALLRLPAALPVSIALSAHSKKLLARGAARSSACQGRPAHWPARGQAVQGHGLRRGREGMAGLS